MIRSARMIRGLGVAPGLLTCAAVLVLISTPPPAAHAASTGDGSTGDGSTGNDRAGAGSASTARTTSTLDDPTLDDPTLHAAFREGELRVAWSEGRREDELRAGISFLETVVARAPQIAEAHALLAQAHSALHVRGDRSPSRRVRAERAAETALRLAPDLAASHLAQGLVFLRVMDDPKRASVEIALAREIDPDDPEILAWVGRLRAREGRFDDALGILRRSHALEPRQPVVLDALAEVAFARGDLSRAVVHAERALALDATAERHLRRAHLRLAVDGDGAQLRATLEGLDEHHLDGAILLRRARAFEAALDRLDRMQVDAATHPDASTHPGAAATLGIERALTLHLSGDRERARTEARDVLDALRNGAVTLRDPLLLATALALDGDAAASAGFLRQLLDDLDPGHDVRVAADLLEQAAFVHVLREDADAAIELLRRRLVLDRRLTPALLRVDPRWDTLREREGFQALLMRAEAWAPEDD